jgi:hypothetical protein
MTKPKLSPQGNRDYDEHARKINEKSKMYGYTDIKTDWIYTVACLLKARIVKPAETALAMERLCRSPLLSNGSAAVT